MDYYNFRIKTDPENVEILLAFLSEMQFDSFEEKAYGLDAFLQVEIYNEVIENQLVALKEKIPFLFEKELVKSQNWNAIWESNFDPLIVDDFCLVRADFHQPVEEVDFEIIINPKMAFGTGHHETTFMMIQSMREIDFDSKKVLDYGCGTGILAILASMLGAKEIDAVDIELESFENTIENAEKNKVFNINAIHGTLENIYDSDYDIILANINRDVILDTMDSLYEKLLKNGKLIVSGILEKDEKLLLEKAESIGFTAKKTIRRNNWMCCHFKKMG